MPPGTAFSKGLALNRRGYKAAPEVSPPSVGFPAFGDPVWEIDTVNLRLRSKDKNIEFIYVITLKTEEYKTIDIVVLPDYELIASEVNPKL